MIITTYFLFIIVSVSQEYEKKHAQCNLSQIITKNIIYPISKDRHSFQSNTHLSVKIKRNIVKMIQNGKKKDEIFVNFSNSYEYNAKFQPIIGPNIFFFMEPLILVSFSIFILIKKIKSITS